MKSEFALAFNEVLEDKGLPRETILEALAQALVSAYRKSVNASNAQEVKAIIDLDNGQFDVLVEKEVVESVQSEQTEVELKEARKYEPEAQLGDLVMVESTPEDFGRVAAQTARQVIQQKIRDAEHSAQIEYYEKQLGEIVSGIVQAANSQGLTIGLELGAEGIMPRREMIPFERFRIHDRARAIVAEIKETGRGPQILLSRTHRDFLRRLLENEVPEIYHGVVEIRSIAREPGQRAKVAVSAVQKGIDPVGACVGMRGVRIQAIVRELHNEKIDVIEYSSDPTVFIAKAISPARVNGVYLRETIEKQKNAMVIVPEDQLSLAIGRDGQNARLAAKLTGWRIDIKSLPESISDWLFALKNKKELKEVAKEEAEAIEKAEELMARKAEGRIIANDDHDFLVEFNDRLERYAIRKQQAKVEAYEEKREEIIEGLPEGAFRVNIQSLDLPSNVIEALMEAGYEDAGELILTSKMNPDALLGVSGIGPKTLEQIQKMESEIEDLVPELPEEPEVEAVPEMEAAEAEKVDEPEAAAEEEPEIAAEAEEALVETEIPEAVETGEEPAEVEEEKEGEEELSFDELFKLKPETFEAEIELDEEEETEEEESGTPSKKKKKSKKRTRRSYDFEYDPELDKTIAKKKHKRGDDEWEDLIDI